MKKVLLFLTFLIYFFSVISCNDEGSKTDTKTATDSLNNNKMLAETISPPNECAAGDSNLLDYWKIDSATANAMITHIGSYGKPPNVKYYRGHIEKKIKDSFPQGKHGWFIASYRSEDVQRYRTKRCFSVVDPAGMVSNYFTKIIKVRVNKRDNLKLGYISYDYYDIATIKPPPEEN